MQKYDLLIIGAGTAGLSAAKEASKHTNNFAIIENGPIGTLCARVGCMPSKALIKAASVYDQSTKLDKFGIKGGASIFPDIPEILQNVRNLRDNFVNSVRESMNNYNVINAKATFVEPNIIDIGNKKIQADKIIICTGSKTYIPNEFRAYEADIITTDSLFEQKDLPKNMAVIGLGNIGAETGQALARLGISIKAFGRSNIIAGITDEEINKTAQEILKEDLSLHLNSSIENIEKLIEILYS
ncbi:FAD-dependent oxidoreductase [Rickettsiales bacterium]|nr:FAD-dependent oxidoreductase [Rickettsiales bacterium]